MPKKNQIIEDALANSSNRRSLLKKLAVAGAAAGAGHHRDAGCVVVGTQASMQTPESRMVVPYTLAVAMFALIWPAGSLRFILSLICVNWYQRW